MPSYLFRCDECEKIEETKLALDAPKELMCSDCGVKMWRLWVSIPAHFKGKGWGKDA